MESSAPRQNEGFGPRALTWAARLPPDVPLITFEFATIAQAFLSAVRRRRAGEPFAASLLLEDPRTKCAIDAAANVMAQAKDYDHARKIFEALANQKLVSPAGLEQAKWITFDPAFLKSAYELLLCADTVVFRSPTESNRVQANLRRLPSVVYAAPPDERVPVPGSATAASPSIAVWAPDQSAMECSLIAFALEECRLPVTIICGGGPRPKFKARFVELRSAAPALASAVAILDGSLYDPGPALALARYGVPMACASTSGAHDYLQGIAVYEPWDYEALFAALTDALGSSAPRFMREHDAQAEVRAGLDYGAALPLITEPLVTCVVPTYNRPQTLANALASIERQHYRNYEVIVVNDAGAPVDELVARFPRARTMNLAQNGGMANAVNAGARAGAGKYLALLADDDEYFPDHLVRLVGALERTGACVASSGELGVHYERLRDGTLKFIGYSTVRSVPASYSRLLLQNMIGGPSIVMQREAFLEVGGFDPEAGHLADFAAWMKLAERYDFVHVDRLTAAMTFRTDTSQLSAVAGGTTARLYRKIYSALPRPIRPGIEELRAEHLAKIEALGVVHAHPTVRADLG